MEHCVLHVEVPRPADGFDPAVRITPSPSRLEVWTLAMDTEMSRYIPGSMNNAPPRRRLMTELEVSTTKPSQSDVFVCPSGQYTTLEFACPVHSGSPCNVDFWQRKSTEQRGGECPSLLDTSKYLRICRCVHNATSVSFSSRTVVIAHITPQGGME